MLKEANFENVYIACGYTDLRYGIDGLAATVKEKFELNPFSPHTIFLLLDKRLEAGFFKWPRKESCGRCADQLLC